MTSRRPFIVAATALSLALTLAISVVSPAVTADLSSLGANDTVLAREPLRTPDQLGDGLLDSVQYADPADELVVVEPPEANSSGAARQRYPIPLPQGRDQPGTTPELALTYDSGAGSSWVGQGWSLDAGGEITVDTSFGVPRFCPRDEPPACGNVESETYALNGDLLSPSAVRSRLLPRREERQDYTRKVEGTYDHIIRHGKSPKDCTKAATPANPSDCYSWEVKDKLGNVYWYGGYPDGGGNTGTSSVPGTRTSGSYRNDETIAPSSILTDDKGNGFTWYLKSQRDIYANSIRYEYETVYYEGVERIGRTTWEKRSAGQCTAVCAKHVYLTSIYYGGATEASTAGSGHGVDEGYKVSFVRHPVEVRPDPVLDGRGGFLDLDIELLKTIKVNLIDDATPANEDDSLISVFELDQVNGPFDKTQLRSIGQKGCALTTGSTCDNASVSWTKYGYYDDAAAASGVGYDGFTERVDWNTQNDPLEQLEGNESAVSMSMTESGDTKVSLGFNAISPTKSGSFGGSVTFDGATVTSLLEFMDINGDDLPDKVYKRGDLIRYRLNTSDPAAALKTPVTFSATEGTVGGLNQLPVEWSWGAKGGPEAYFGVNATFSAGGVWTRSDGYFTDANGDGLPDFTRNGVVFFNECKPTGSTGACVPTFTQDDSSKTRNPLAPLPSSGANDGVLAQQLEIMKKVSPPIDTVRRWVAPAPGLVRVESTATLNPVTSGVREVSDAACGNDTGGAIVWIQRGNTVFDKCELRQPGDRRSKSVDIGVAKGDKIYFRLSPGDNALATDTSWNQTITYIEWPANPKLDENGESPRVYNAASDFTLAGRPGMFIGLPKAGPVSFTGRLTKAQTSDDLRFTVLHRFGAANKPVRDLAGAAVWVTAMTPDGSQEDMTRRRVVQARGPANYCVETLTVVLRCYSTEDAANDARAHTLFSKETGLFKLEASDYIDAPVKDSSGREVGFDSLEMSLRATSPVDPTAIVWKTAPELCYGTGIASSCGPNDLKFPAMVDTTVYGAQRNYPRLDNDSLPSSANGRYDVSLEFDAGVLSTNGPALTEDEKEVWLTFKSGGGEVVKAMYKMPQTTAWAHHTLPVELALDPAKRYWVDVSVRSQSLFDAISGVQVNIRPKGSTAPYTKASWVQLNGPGSLDYFPLGYRGWAVAGYRADGALRNAPLDQAKFRLTNADGSGYASKDAGCIATTGAARCANPTPTGVGDTSVTSVADKVPSAFMFLPKRALGPTGTLVESWAGPNDSVWASPSNLSASRIRPLPPVGQPAAPSPVSPPTMLSEAKPALAAGLSAGPLNIGASFGWTRATIGYLDMNGDDLPDKVSSASIEYSNPRGGNVCDLQTGVGPCAGPGLAETNANMSIQTSQGLNVAVPGLRSNSRGSASATRGDASLMGGPANGSSDGANLGIGLGFTEGWSPPIERFGVNATYDHQFDFVPGQPFEDPGAVFSQTLADLNADGLPDQVKTTKAGVFTKFNLGYKFTSSWRPWSGEVAFEANKSVSGALGASPGFATPTRDFTAGFSRNAAVDMSEYTFDDVNGDDLPDALRARPDGQIGVRFGTALGLQGETTYGTFGAQPFAWGGPGPIATGQRVRQDKSIGWGGGGDFTVGVPLPCPQGCYLILGLGVHGERAVSLGDVDFTDVNGDGYADSVQRGTGDQTMGVRLNKLGRTGLLRQVINPLGGIYELDYTRAGNTTAHPGSVWTMSKVKVVDGRPGDGVDDSTTTYEYKNPAYDFVNREGLGFSEIVSRDLAADGAIVRSTRRTFSNASIFDAGLEQLVELYQGQYAAGSTNNVLWERQTSTWQILDGDSQQPLPPQLEASASLTSWATPLLLSQKTEHFKPGTDTLTEEVRYWYDRLGNPVTIMDRGDVTTGVDDLYTMIDYSNCATSATSDPAPGGYNLMAECGPAGPGGVRKYNSPDQQPAFWTPHLCPTWVSVPIRIMVTDQNNKVLRYRDGPQDVCDNLMVTHQRELISGDPFDGSGVFAETDLYFDYYGNYSYVVYPEAAPRAGETFGRRHAVRYTFDTDRNFNIDKVEEFDLRPQDVAPFLADVMPSDQASVGLTSTATFNPRVSKVASRTDANGKKTSYEYDGFGRLAKVDMPEGAFVTYGYAPTDAPMGYSYAVARHSDKFNPGDTIDTYSFVDGLGRVTQQKHETVVFQGVDKTAANGFAVSGLAELDGLGRPVKEWQPSFEPVGTASTFQRLPSTQATTRQFDIMDRPVSVTEPGDRTTNRSYSFVRDPLLNQTVLRDEITDPLLRKTATLFDIRGFTRAVDDKAVGKQLLRTTYDYDALGQLATVTQAAKEQLSYTYDKLGRATSSTTQDGGRVEVRYDAAGNKTAQQTPVQRIENAWTTYSYAFGRLLRTDHPRTPDVTMKWGGYLGVPQDGNGAGRVVELSDAARQQWFGYDSFGNVSSEKTKMLDPFWQADLVTTSSYDWLGRLAQVGYPDGELVSHDYDKGGQLSRISGVKGIKPYRYLDKQEYDVFGFPAYRQLGNDNQTGYERDPKTLWLARQVTTSAYHGTTTETVGSLRVDLAAGIREMKVNEVFSPPVVPFVAQVGPEKVRVTAREKHADGSYTYTVDRGVEGTTQALRGSSTPVTVNTNHVVQNLSYGYDKVGNVTGAVNDLPAPEQGPFGGRSTQSYTYDPYYRIKSSTGSWAKAQDAVREYSTTWAYDDPTGNVTHREQKVWDRKTACADPCSSATTLTDLSYTYANTYSPSRQHQRESQGTSSVKYDDNGNVIRVESPDNIRTMTWNDDNRMVGIVDTNNNGGPATRYAYDYAGNLAFEDGKQGRTFFVNPYVTVKNGSMWKHYFAGDQRMAMRLTQTVNEDKLYFVEQDLQGNTNLVSDAAGAVYQHSEYLPSGEKWVDFAATLFKTPYQLSGKYADEDHGISDFGQRWYEPRAGLFYGVDPALTEDLGRVVSSPGLASTYTFANNNPVTFIDPDGRSGRGANAGGARYGGVRPMATLTNRVRNAFHGETGLVGGALGSFYKLAGGINRFARWMDMKPLVDITVDQSAGVWKIFSVGLYPGFGSGHIRTIHQRKTYIGDTKTVMSRLGFQGFFADPGPNDSSSDPTEAGGAVDKVQHSGRMSGNDTDNDGSPAPSASSGGTPSSSTSSTLSETVVETTSESVVETTTASSTRSDSS